MQFHFTKYHGTGNDFILIDNRQQIVALSQAQIATLCHRRFGIGADGLMLLENAPHVDFKMVYYNADGHPSSMCGNGGRCITQYARQLGLQNNEYRFQAIDGTHQSWIDDDAMVHLKMNDVSQITHHNAYQILNTGSPHYVKLVTDLDTFDVYKHGHEIRNSEKFKAEGINVNFVEILKPDRIFVRTYERGVEAETYSCGTGVTAAALAFAHNDNGFNHIDIKTIGGNLHVEFNKMADQQFANIWLTGPAVKVYQGSFEI